MDQQDPNLTSSGSGTQVNSGSVHSIDIQAPNPGNPVFTCDKRFTDEAPTMVTNPQTQEERSKPQHPMYATTSSTYGALGATVETTPNSFHGTSQRFSEHLGKSGMYRNHSLNTAKDISMV